MCARWVLTTVRNGLVVDFQNIRQFEVQHDCVVGSARAMLLVVEVSDSRAFYSRAAFSASNTSGSTREAKVSASLFVFAAAPT